MASKPLSENMAKKRREIMIQCQIYSEMSLTGGYKVPSNIQKVAAGEFHRLEARIINEEKEEKEREIIESMTKKFERMTMTEAMTQQLDHLIGKKLEEMEKEVDTANEEPTIE